ncbi:MAG: hypothetical protein ACRC8L_10590, partial [Plesiomonas shigelloides]
ALQECDRINTKKILRCTFVRPRENGLGVQGQKGRWIYVILKHDRLSSARLIMHGCENSGCMMTAHGGVALAAHRRANTNRVILG